MFLKTPYPRAKWIPVIFLLLMAPVLAIGIHEITPKILLEKIEAGNADLIIDLRDQDKYLASHIPTAINILPQDINKKIDTLINNKNEPVILYCGDGTRSASTMNVLRKHGFNNLLNVNGNMNAWLRKKLPVETGNN